MQNNSEFDELDSLNETENMCDLTKLIRKIFTVIPSYYDPDEAKEVRRLILDYINNLKQGE